MGPYSHYVLASRLATSFEVANRSAYTWGAVSPDIRYLAQMPREQTHLAKERLVELMTCYPHLRSFITGYLVHVLIDQVDVLRVVGSGFPLNLLKKVTGRSLSPQQMTMMVEVYYLQSRVARGPLSGEHNELFTNLGITQDQTSRFHKALQAYFDNRSYQGAIEAFKDIGMIHNSRIEKYKDAYAGMQKRKGLRTLLMLSIKSARLEMRTLEHVRGQMAGLALS